MGDKMALQLGSRFFVIAMMIAGAGASNQYTVGDEGGWHVPGDDAADLYQTWANKIRFQVGDRIVFQYGNDSVVRVDKRGYYHCNETSRGSFFRDGNTVFLLDRPGFYYFVSGDLEHCKKGQRVMIEVVGPPSPFPFGPSPSPSPSSVASCSVSMIVAIACGLSLGFVVLGSVLF